MKLRRIVQAGALMAAAVLLCGQAPRSNWDQTVVQTELGHRVGNPDARVRVVEFFSYTCPHCGEFAREGDAALSGLRRKLDRGDLVAVLGQVRGPRLDD